MTTILLVEDDVMLGDSVKTNLEADGFEVSWIQDGRQALVLDVEGFDLVVLDLMLPGVHGFDLLKRWRETSDVPVIILTARTDTHDKIRGFKLGGDDYVTKPFWPEELTARINARLRRPAMSRGTPDTVGPIQLDREARRVWSHGVEVEMTRVEFDVLAVLFSRADKAVSRRQLVERVLDEDREGTERTLDVHVSRLRKKLGAASDYIETVWGVGYRLAITPKGSK